ncbi:MAG: tungsten ABC transporter substrate-binding protein, partial [Candidatus Methanomethylicia archaeon]|nr:tungsten ABC transporter substrate-binding protein [Candidatus Methanomethylicia archaeon]
MWKPSRALSIALLSTVAIVSSLAYEQYFTSGGSVVVLATTTSTYDSGLLDYLLPKFESEYGVKVHMIPVGTG